MRVTNQMFFQNLRHNYSSTMSNLYKTNEQLASGMKIQHNFEDSGVYTDTMRLDYELTTLEQVKQSSSKAQTFANNTDKAMNQFSESLATIKTKLIQAANGVNSTTSMEAIANDIEALRGNLMNIANTSINGQFLFSGTDMQQKPISSDGNYHGNNETVETVVGSGVRLPYNIPGRDLFQGRDQDYNKIIKSNIQLFDQTDLTKEEYIKEDSTIEQLIGEHAGDTVFYLQGKNPDGKTFAQRFSLAPNAKMTDVLTKIGQEYGNTTNNKVVDVSINDSGQIVLKDMEKGNSNLDFFFVAATDTIAGAGMPGAAEVDDISTLTTNPNVKITSFINSNYKDLSNNPTSSTDYDKVQFNKNGNKITSTVSQVNKQTNLYATGATKLSEVAGASLNGKEFKLEGNDISGNTYDVTINFTNTSSTFTIAGNTYDILDKDGNSTSADNITYQQINDVISMVTANSLPASASHQDYESAIKQSRNSVEVDMDYKGRIAITDRGNEDSQISTALYDNSHATGAFAGGGSDGSVLSFTANNAIIEDDAYIDIFKDLEDMINAVRMDRKEADGNGEDPRNMGIEAALAKLDHISDHFAKRHVKIGSLSNSLKYANERAELLSLNVKSVQSEVIDADYGESLLKFNQLSINYQAMLQAVSKINSLSLVNYI